MEKLLPSVFFLGGGCALHCASPGLEREWVFTAHPRHPFSLLQGSQRCLGTDEWGRIPPERNRGGKSPICSPAPLQGARDGSVLLPGGKPTPPCRPRNPQPRNSPPHPIFLPLTPSGFGLGETSAPRLSPHPAPGRGRWGTSWAPAAQDLPRCLASRSCKKTFPPPSFSDFWSVLGPWLPRFGPRLPLVLLAPALLPAGDACSPLSPTGGTKRMSWGSKMPGSLADPPRWQDQAHGERAHPRGAQAARALGQILLPRAGGSGAMLGFFHLLVLVFGAGGSLPLAATPPQHPGSLVSLTPDYTRQALHRCRCSGNVSSPRQP